jgi:hypothetical protein
MLIIKIHFHIILGQTNYKDCKMSNYIFSIAGLTTQSKSSSVSQVSKSLSNSNETVVAVALERFPPPMPAVWRSIVHNHRITTKEAIARALQIDEECIRTTALWHLFSFRLWLGRFPGAFKVMIHITDPVTKLAVFQDLSIALKRLTEQDRFREAHTIASEIPDVEMRESILQMIEEAREKRVAFALSSALTTSDAEIRWKALENVIAFRIEWEEFFEAFVIAKWLPEGTAKDCAFEKISRGFVEQGRFDDATFAIQLIGDKELRETLNLESTVISHVSACGSERNGTPNSEVTEDSSVERSSKKKR